jgi:hypothetical protein
MTAGSVWPLARLVAVLAVLWACVAILVTAGWPWALLIVLPALALYAVAAWHLLHR